MEQDESGKSKGYQKQVKKDVQPAKPKKSGPVDYSSPAAKKWPKFLEALDAGNAEDVRQLIEEGLNVNVIRDGVTPLMSAVSKGHVAVAEVILQAGVNINERNEEGWTALHKAAYEQPDVGVVELLMQSGIDVRAKNKSGRTAQQLAEEQGHREIVKVITKYLEKDQADAREWEEFLNSLEGKPYKQQRLFDKMDALSNMWWLPVLALGGLGLAIGFLVHALVLAGGIGFALAGGVVAAFHLKKTFLRKYLDDIGPLPELDLQRLREMKKTGETVVVLGNVLGSEPGDEAAGAGMNGEAGAAQEASSDDEGAGDVFGAEESEPKKSASFLANMRKKPAVYAAALIVVVLVAGVLIIERQPLARWFYTGKLERSGAQFTEQGFLESVAGNKEATVDLYLRAGMAADAKNAKGQTALFIAVEKGHANLVDKLAKLAPSLIDRHDVNGMTPLMTAAQQGNEQIVKILLDDGAVPGSTVPDREGPATALQAALNAPEFREQHLRVMQALIQKGAPVNGRNAPGQFPLLFAAVKGRKDAAALLLEKGAGVNDADLNGVFPLLAAACKGYPDLVSLLMDKGADLSKAMPDGQTPLMCASREGHENVVRALLGHGAQINAKSTTGETALAAACMAGNPTMAQVLVEQGADPSGVGIPDALVSVPGRTVTLNAKKHKAAGAVLKLIAAAALQDGYTVMFSPLKKSVVPMTLKAGWNKALIALAGKNNFLLVVKDKAITILQYDPAAIKRLGSQRSES